MNLPIIVHKLFEVTIMSRSAQGIILLLLSVLAVSFLVSYAVIPTSATTIVQLQPNTVSSGDRVYVTANLAENSSTVTLSYYADLNKNGKDDDGGSWIKIANVTDGGANDGKNTSNGFINFQWMTPSLSPGQYIVKVEDPKGPTRTTVLTVNNANLKLIPTIVGPSTSTDKGLVKPGDYFSVSTQVTGNCRLCHTTDNPTTQNPGVNQSQVDKAFSADLSGITGSSGDTAVDPTYVHHQLVQWSGIASKTLVDNQTVNVTVTGTNPAGNLTTQSTAFAGVNKAVNIPPKSSNDNSTQGNASSAQSSGSTSNPLPGFEAVFVVAGLTFVAYLMSRRR
jgi:PGF-CTERM protein